MPNMRVDSAYTRLRAHAEAFGTHGTWRQVCWGPRQLAWCPPGTHGTPASALTAAASHPARSPGSARLGAERAQQHAEHPAGKGGGGGGGGDRRSAAAGRQPARITAWRRALTTQHERHAAPCQVGGEACKGSHKKAPNVNTATPTPPTRVSCCCCRCLRRTVNWSSGDIQTSCCILAARTRRMGVRLA